MEIVYAKTIYPCRLILKNHVHKNNNNKKTTQYYMATTVPYIRGVPHNLHGRLQPLLAVNEGDAAEGSGLARGQSLGPTHTPVAVGAGTRALVLGVVHRLLTRRDAPVEPPGGSDDVGDVALVEHHARVRAPCAAQVDRPRSPDGALVENEPCGRVAEPVLRRDGPAGALRDGRELAVLVERLPVAKDPVDGSHDLTAAEEVSARLVVQGILRSQEAAPVERALVTLDTQSHRLRADGTTGRSRGRVLQSDQNIESVHCEFQASVAMLVKLAYNRTPKYIVTLRF
jgi:hypothetical protein